MQVHGIAWVGTRTDRWSETVEMFERHLGLHRRDDQPGIAVFALDNGDTVEVFTTTNRIIATSRPARWSGSLLRTSTPPEPSWTRRASRSWVRCSAVGYGVAAFPGADGNVWELTAHEA